MHTISINLYTFEELAPEVQRTVIERERYFNVDDSWWYKPIIEDWTAQLEQHGFEQVKILFSGFGSQGDGRPSRALYDLVFPWLAIKTSKFGLVPEVKSY